VVLWGLETVSEVGVFQFVAFPELVRHFARLALVRDFGDWPFVLLELLVLGDSLHPDHAVVVGTQWFI